MLQLQSPKPELRFQPAGDHRDCGTFDPFTDGDADTIQALLLSALRRQDKARAHAELTALDAPVQLLLTSIPTVLVHARKVLGAPITPESIRLGFAFRSLWDLATTKRFHVRDPRNGAIGEILVPNFPDAMIAPVRHYLSSLPGCDLSAPLSDRQVSELTHHHQRNLQPINPALATIGFSLWHLFKVWTEEDRARAVDPYFRPRLHS